MDKFLLPSVFKVEESEKPNIATIVLEPCYHGYGTTLGNTLRRVLLSSLPGAAVTAVKIKGATHEFTILENVKEDVVEIILNLKRLRLRVFSSEEVKLNLVAKGEGVVTAAQIEATADVEIVNSDLPIATLSHKDAKLEMEIFVSQGRGYVPVEEKEKTKLELGTIAIDSIFNPVLNVGYRVDFVRVGEITNFERLSLTIETDGTITPVNALIQSARILVDHFNLVLENFGGETIKPEAFSLGEEKDEKNNEEKDGAVSLPVEQGEIKKAKKRGRPPGSKKKK